jgi:hypothetical protein
VAATDRHARRVTAAARRRTLRHSAVGLLLLLSLTMARAAVLPDERTDLMYHYYDGGGVTVSGPAVLVRKSAGDNVSVSGRYYVDTVSSASIDVVTTASPYRDRREEIGIGVDILNGNSLASLSLTKSTESDYLADTLGLNVTHDLFGGLTTVELGFSNGRDTVERVHTTFQRGINRYNFRLGVTQVLTRSLLAGLSFEDVAEDGYLNNPYRFARVAGVYFPEIYPGTRDSQALALRLVKGFASEGRPAGSSARAEYRYYRDNWDIRSSTLGLAYQRYFGDSWLGELHYRYYQQNAASFYSDNFATEMTYMARDKELSTFHSHSLGVKWTWYFARRKFLFLDRASLNFSQDYIYFSYDDFTDVRTGQAYSFGANVLQIYISAWY